MNPSSHQRFSVSEALVPESNFSSEHLGTFLGSANPFNSGPKLIVRVAATQRVFAVIVLKKVNIGQLKFKTV